MKQSEPIPARNASLSVEQAARRPTSMANGRLTVAIFPIFETIESQDNHTRRGFVDA
jgi:hypothetical protein